MLRAILSLVAIACLAGCVSDSAPVQAKRYYVDYKALLMEGVDHAFMGGPKASAPGPVKLAYAECSADYALTGFTENERARLDAFARREITLTNGEMRDLDSRLRSRLGNSLEFDDLAGTCPDKVPLFKKYLN
jgi:hypothetical protein